MEAYSVTLKKIEKTVIALAIMTKDKAYALTGLWALFMSLVHTGRKYFSYKESGQEEMTEWKVLGLHFVATFGILLLIGILIVFVYFKFVKKDKE